MKRLKFGIAGRDSGTRKGQWRFKLKHNGNVVAVPHEQAKLAYLQSELELFLRVSRCDPARILFELNHETLLTKNMKTLNFYKLNCLFDDFDKETDKLPLAKTCSQIW